MDYTAATVRQRFHIGSTVFFWRGPEMREEAEVIHIWGPKMVNLRLQDGSEHSSVPHAGDVPGAGGRFFTFGPNADEARDVIGGEPDVG